MSAVLFPPSKRSVFTFILTKQMVKLFSVTESSLYGMKRVFELQIFNHF